MASLGHNELMNLSSCVCKINKVSLPTGEHSTSGHYRKISWSRDAVRFRAPSQYPKRRLSVRSRQVSKPRDLYLELSDRFEIWQALRQQCCRCACQISKRYDNLKYQSRGFETLEDLTKRRLFGYWDGAQIPTFQMALNVDRQIGNSATEMPVTFQSVTIIITSNLAVSRLHEVWREDVLPLSK